MSRSQHVWLSTVAVIASVVLSWGGAVWWLLGPGQMATGDDIAQVRAELRAAREELRESTRARQRMVDEIGRLVREADGGNPRRPQG